MTIKNLVLSGGSYNGLKTLGALKYLNDSKFYDIENIENIYATSVGSIMGVLLALKLPFENILDYAIRKPWNKVFNFTADMLFSMITEKGIIDKSFIIEIFDILFKTADISNKTTMLEFYNKSKIKLHFYTTNVKLFETVELSHTSHPELSVIDAVYMSCSIPFIFQPIYFKDSYMIDGAVLCNFPLNQCCEQNEDTDSILAINLIDGNKKKHTIDKNTNLFKYGHFIFDSLVNYSNQKKRSELEIKYILNIMCENSNISYGYELLENSEERKTFINKGIEFAKLFVETHKKNTCEDDETTLSSM